MSGIKIDGAKLRRLRENKGLTRETFATSTGTTLRWLRALETAKTHRGASVERVARFAAELGTTIEDLRGDGEAPA